MGEVTLVRSRELDREVTLVRPDVSSTGRSAAVHT